MQHTFDIAKAEKFAGQLFSYYTGGLITLMVDVGHRTGLFGAAAKGPATSEELARRAGLNERYVREWLGAMVTSRVFTYDREAGTYTLPPEHAASLAGDTPFNMAPVSQMLAQMGKHVHKLAHAFQHGGGVPYSEFRPEFTDLMDKTSRRGYDYNLIRKYIPAAQGLRERLEAGIRAADIGCGTGHCVNILAAEFPNSTFVGYDIASDAIERGRAEAQEMGLSNAAFEVLDVAQLPAEPRFDLITAFDAIHDQVDPAAVLRRVHEAVAPDGVFLMVDIRAASDLADNLDNPMAPFLYSISVLHCLTVSLAHGGAGLGTVWGEQLARQMLAEAGFTRVEVTEAPDPMNNIYVCRK